jgi:hypothetical protein
LFCFCIQFIIDYLIHQLRLTEIAKQYAYVIQELLIQFRNLPFKVTIDYNRSRLSGIWLLKWKFRLSGNFCEKRNFFIVMKPDKWKSDLESHHSSVTGCRKRKRLSKVPEIEEASLKLRWLKDLVSCGGRISGD